MTLSRIVAFNTVAQSIGKAISLVAGVLLTSVLTRKLGVAEYGGYIYIYTVVLFANALADWGSTIIATREAAKAGERQPQVFGTALILKVLSSLVVTAILIWLTQTQQAFAAYRQVFLVAGFLIPLLSIKTFFQIIFQTRLELWKLSLIDTASSMAFLLFIALTPTELIGLRLVFAFLIAAALVSIVIGEIFIFREVKLSLTLDRKLITTLVTGSAIMGLQLTLFSMYNRLDIVLLERLKGQEAVGIYGLSYKIYENLVVGAAFFSNSIFPILASRVGQKKLFRRTFQKVIGSLFLAGIVVSLVTVVLAAPVVAIISGPDFARSVAPLQILAFSLVVSYLNHAVGYTLIALNRQAVTAIIASVALALNLSLNWLFIPRFSYLASATVTMVTELVVFICSIIVIRRIIGRLSLSEALTDLDPRLIWKKLRR